MPGTSRAWSKYARAQRYVEPSGSAGQDMVKVKGGEDKV